MATKKKASSKKGAKKTSKKASSKKSGGLSPKEKAKLLRIVRSFYTMVD